MLEPNSVNAGDELVEKSDGNGGMRIVTVAKVTASGQVVLTNGERYRPDGTQSGRYWETSTLFIATPELRQEIQRQANVFALKNIDWSKLEAEKLEQIVAILESEIIQ